MPDTLTWEEAQPQANTFSWEDAQPTRAPTTEESGQIAGQIAASAKAQEAGRAKGADNTGMTGVVAQTILGDAKPDESLAKLALRIGGSPFQLLDAALPHLTDEERKSLAKTSPDWEKTEAGAELLGKIAPFLIPIGAAAEGARGASAISKVAGSAFGAGAATQLPEVARQSGSVFGDPKNTPGQKILAGGELGITAGIAALGLGGAAMPAKAMAEKLNVTPEANQTFVDTAKVLPRATSEAIKTEIEKGKNEEINTKNENVQQPVGPLPGAEGATPPDAGAEQVVKPTPPGTPAPNPETRQEHLLAGDLVPAIKQGDGQIVTAQPGDHHADIIARSSKEGVLADGEKGFMDKTGNFLSREQASAALGEKNPLHSEKLYELQKPETKAVTAVVPKKTAATSFQSLDEIDASKLTSTQKTKARDAFLKSKGVQPPRDESRPIVSMGGKAPGDPGEIHQANLAALGSSLKTLADSNPRPAVTRAFNLGEHLAPIKDGIQNTLQGLRAVGSYLKTKLEGFPEFGKFDGLLGDRHLALSESALNARRFVKDATKAIPDKLTREAISNWVDNGGDEAKLRQGLSSTEDRYKPGYERALKLTDEEQTIAKNIQNYFEARLTDAQQAGILEDGIENYIHRYFEKDSPWKQSILNELRSGIFTGQPALAKQRVFEYDHEAEDAGYKPEKDFVKRVAAYDLALNKAIADRQLVKGLMNLKTPGGEPWISVGGVSKKIGGVGTDSALLIKPTVKPKNLAEYRTFDHPALRKWKWVAEGDDGKPILVQGSVLVHPDALPQVRALFESSRIRANPLGRAALNLGSTVKNTMLDLSLFHQFQIGVHAGEHQRFNTFKQAEPIDLTDTDQRGLVRGGMVIGDTTGRQHFDEGLSGSSLSRHLPLGIGDKIQQYKEYLFGDYIPRLKMQTGLMALERNRKLFPNLSPDEVNHLTANQMNAAFGELNYAMMGRSATAQDAFRLTLLSPDFTEARMRFAGQSITKYGGRPHFDEGKLKIGEQGKALLFGAFALYMTARIINKLTNGAYHFELENAFNVIRNGKAYSLRTVQGDIIHAATDPASFVRNRLNPVYGRTAMEIASGRDTFGRKRDMGQQATDAAKTVIPISARGLFSGREQSLAESLMNSMGVTEHRESATQRISQLADAWKAKNKVYGEPGEFIYDPDKDKFRNITLAARYSDAPSVRSEILKANQQGVPTSAIVKHYNLSAKHLFTGSTKANEEKFKASLTPDQRKQYQDALKERNDISIKVKNSVP